MAPGGLGSPRLRLVGPWGCVAWRRRSAGAGGGRAALVQTLPGAVTVKGLKTSKRNKNISLSSHFLLS